MKDSPLKTAPLHILLSVNAAWNIWNFRRALVEALIADGHRVTVLAPPDDTVANLERIGCRFLPLEMNVRGLNPLQDLKLMRRFKRVFRSEQPDVVLSYTIKNNIFGALAAKTCNNHFIPNITGLGTAFLSGRLLQIVAEGLYRKAFGPLSHVFFQNPDDRDLFLERRLVQSSQAHLLPGSGIDLHRFPATQYPAETQAPVFLMIARLLRDKGVVEFVEAARLVKAKLPDTRFQLLGDVDAANRSAIDNATVKSWQDGGSIEYLGTKDDVRPHIAAAQCIVLPSYREGAPRTLIEGAAMARPLVTTDVPGCRSIVDDGINGFLCEACSGESLAEACLSFLDLSHEEKTSMGRAGRKKMEAEFDQANVVQIYRDAIASEVAHKRIEPTP
jgi:glycosyltransferase involved in cell wall biosynthesis